MTSATRVAIVEDHRLLAESVSLALRAEGLDVVLGDLTDEASLLQSLCPDDSLLVLLDLDLGQMRDGARLIPVLRAAGAHVLVVTGTRDTIRIAAAVEAGAIGYVGKDQPIDVLLGTVQRAVAGQSVFRAGERHELLAQLRRHRAEEGRRLGPFQALTPKERQVLDALRAGRSVDRIATDWVVSEATVRTQVRGVLTKLDVRSQLAAVAKAHAAGWRRAG
jgi:two-component system nitrate/nitrite response regulator NarL